MHLALLMTNTDESGFAQQHPKDGEKFTRLVHLVRPEWQVTSFVVKDGVFPDDLRPFDGIMISGSPASVHDDAPWIGQLMALIQKAFTARIPMFGACFGHQAIALALGGTVERNPSGWGFGLTEMTALRRPDWYDGPEVIRQFAAHIEHVTRLPVGAEPIFAAPACDNAAFVIGDRVFTTQNHPEMTAEFFAALTEELSDYVGPEVASAARASLSEVPDTIIYAETIARFFEVPRTAH